MNRTQLASTLILGAAALGITTGAAVAMGTTNGGATSTTPAGTEVIAEVLPDPRTPDQGPQPTLDPTDDVVDIDQTIIVTGAPTTWVEADTANALGTTLP